MTLEQRVTVLEEEIAELKLQLEERPDLKSIILETFEENRDKIMVYR